MVLVSIIVLNVLYPSYAVNHLWCYTHAHTHNRFTALFSRSTWVSRCQKRTYWTFWCKGRLTEADTPTIRTNQCQHPPSPIFLQVLWRYRLPLFISDCCNLRA